MHAIWYTNMFELGFANTGNPAMFAWENLSPLVLLDPEFSTHGVTAVFTGWSFSGYPSGSGSKPETWEGSEIPTPFPKEHAFYKRRNVVATANFTIPKVTYLDFDGTSGKMSERTDECELVKAETTTFEAGKVYAVVRDVTIEKRITVSGTPANPTKLVLCDGVTLAVTNGVEVADGSALIICGQALGTGMLEATGSSGAAGIGSGGSVTINGGTVMAAGGSSSAGIGGGTVTINGGMVTVTGNGGAAGIAGTVKFADGTVYGVAAGADEANALYMTAAAFTADHSAAYVALPYFSLKILEATEGCSYEVSCAGVESKAALANQTNTYAIATGATARVRFTLVSEDYEWVKAPEENPMILANISGDTVIDAANLPTTKYAPKGSADNPWTIGKTAGDSVTAYTNGVGGLVIEGSGNMKDFDPSGDPAPWGTDIAEVEIGEDVTGIGAKAFAGCTSLSSVTVEAMTPPTLGADAFAELPEGFKIAVPAGTGAAYKAAPGWSDYADRIVEGKPGSPGNPWTVGTPNADDVTAYTNGVGGLVVEGAGDMRDFAEGDPAPWGTDIAEVEIGEGVTSIGAKAFAGSTSLSNVVINAMTPPVLGADAFADPAEGFRVCVPHGTVEAYKAAPGWSDFAENIVEQGTPECPWEIGEGVEAYLNGTELVIQGTGTITDLSEIPDSVKDGLTAVTITEPTVTGAAEDAFLGLDGIALTLPDGWQGELPDEDGNWYGATGAMMEKWPLAVKNMKAQQRYPWNGLVDIGFTLTGPVGETNVIVTVRDGATDVTNFTAAVTIPVGGTLGTSLAWDAEAAGLAAEFKSDAVTVEVKIAASDIAAKSAAGTVDLRTSVELADGETTVSNVAWSATLWGTVPETFTTVGWTNLSTGATGVFGNLSNIMGEGVKDAVLPEKDGDYLLTHSTGGLKSFATFTVSGTGNPVGSKSNPWVVGATAEDGVVAYTNGVGGVVIGGEGDMKDFTADDAPWGKAITSAEIGGNVTGIGTNAFTGCASLTNVTVLAVVPPSMDGGAFAGCDGLATINVPRGAVEAYKTAPGWSEYVAMIVEPGTPENPWKVGDGVTAYIDESGTLHVDGEGAMTDFSDDSPAPWATTGIPVTSAEVGEDVTGIGTNAFKDCTSLTNVTVLATVPPSLGGGAFSGCDSLENILVPWETGDDYRAASDWSEYAEKILEMPGSAENPWAVGPDGDPDGTVAWRDEDGDVYFKPPRGTVSRTGLETVTNAMGGASFPVGLISADGTATNDLVMVIGASGARYDSLEEALEAGEDSYRLYDVEGCVVNYDGMGAMGEMPSDTFLPNIPTNLTANAYTAFGYTFQGWTTNGDTKVIFKDKAKIADPQPGDIYDLQAVWTCAPVPVGDGVGAYLDTQGTLHVEGEGAMKDFTAADPAPWAQYASQVKSVEIGTGVTKVGNAAFTELDFMDTTSTLSVVDDTHELNLLAFVEPDGSETNAPWTSQFRVVRDETVESVAAFGPKDSTAYYGTIEEALAYGDTTSMLLLTLAETAQREKDYLTATAGEKPYSKAMQDLLDAAFAKLDDAEGYGDVVDAHETYADQIEQQAGKDESHEIEGYDITWRVMDGELVLNGEGKMPDFIEPAFTNGAPWNVMKADITNVTVAVGIAPIGDAAFAVCPAGEGASVLFMDPEAELNLGAFVSGDGSTTNVPTVKVEIVTEDEKGEHKLRVVPGGWTDADDPNVTYESLEEALEDGARAVKAAFEKKTDEGEKPVPPAEVEEIVKTVPDPDDPRKEIELTAKYENNPTAEGSTAGLVSEIENLPLIVDNTGSNIVITVTATNKMDKMVTKEGSDVVKEMDGAMSNDCEIVKAMLAPDVATENFDSSYLDMSAFFNFKNDSGRLVEFTQSIIAHIPMKLYDGQIYSVSRRHQNVTEVLPLWYEGIDDSDTAEWVKVDVANQELVVKTRKFCDYALGALELEKSCQVTVGDSGKALGAADPNSLATNFQVRVTGELNASEFGGYCRRAKGEDEGDYAINFICTRMPQGYEGPSEVEPGTFTISEPEMLEAAGTVKYPSAVKKNKVDTGLLKEKANATWRATAQKGCVFAGWTAADDAPDSVTNHLAVFSENELRDPKLTFRVGDGEQIAPTNVAANWARIDEDAIESVDIDTNRLCVVTKSYVTATVTGLPAGLKFNKKTLAITGTVKAKDKTYKVKVSVKNASGYTWKQTFGFEVEGNVVTKVVPAEDCVTTGVPVMLWCDPEKGSVKGTGVYALGKAGTKRVSINATAKTGYVFAGWYLDPGFSEPAYELTASGNNKDYRQASQTITVTEPTYLFARFVEKTTKADPITHLRFNGAGYCGAAKDWLAEDETWYQGVALPTNGCQIAFGSLSLPKVTVTGLPAGVKFDKKALRFTGVPTACSTEKKPFFTVKISVKNASGATDVLVKKVYVKPLPAWAVGTFDGYHMEGGATNGTFTATVGKTGKVSGKTKGGLAGTTFSAKNFANVKPVGDALCYVADVTVSYKDPSTKKTVKATDTLYLMEDGETKLGVIGGGDGEGCGCMGVQRAWDRKADASIGFKAFPAFDTKALKDPVKIPSTELTLKFGAKGKVTVGGKVDGVKVSGSTYVKPFAWHSTMTTVNLFAQVPVYVAPKKTALPDGFCAVYDVLLTVGESGIDTVSVADAVPSDLKEPPQTIVVSGLW